MFHNKCTLTNVHNKRLIRWRYSQLVQELRPHPEDRSGLVDPKKYVLKTIRFNYDYSVEKNQHAEIVFVLIEREIYYHIKFI